MSAWRERWQQAYFERHHALDEHWELPGGWVDLSPPLAGAQGCDFHAPMTSSRPLEVCAQDSVNGCRRLITIAILPRRSRPPPISCGLARSPRPRESICRALREGAM